MNEDLTNLSLSELFDELIPPTAPPDVSMAPQTVGWIWLGVAVLAILGFLFQRWLKHRHANAYRRQAINALTEAGEDPIALASVLRQTALAAFPRADVASLIGENWLAFLDNTVGKPLFSGTVAGQSLTRSPYRPTTEPTDLPARTKEWVTTHKVSKPQDGGQK